MAQYFKRKKKVCYMCTGKEVDYKDTETLKKFISETGKILPRKATGACAKHQRAVAREIKKAREIALIPYTTNKKM